MRSIKLSRRAPDTRGKKLERGINRKFTYWAALSLFVLMVGVPVLQADSINVEFGVPFRFGTPSSSFGAAANQPGPWNSITLGTTSGLVDLNGETTIVGVTVTADVASGNADTFGSPDAQALMGENFYVENGRSWTVGFTGLANALYDVYLYDPSNAGVGTGAGTLNEHSFTNINNNNNFFGGTFELGVNYHRIENVVVSNGVLTVIGSQPGTYSGLAGLQLVEKSRVPEEPTLVLVGIGLAALAMVREKKICQLLQEREKSRAT